MDSIWGKLASYDSQSEAMSRRMTSRTTYESHDGAKLGSKLAVLCVKGVKRDQKGTKKGVKRDQRGLKRCLGCGMLEPVGGLGGRRILTEVFQRGSDTLRSRLKALGGGYIYIYIKMAPPTCHRPPS